MEGPAMVAGGFLSELGSVLMHRLQVNSVLPHDPPTYGAEASPKALAAK
jgi:hypothetical protein